MNYEFNVLHHVGVAAQRLHTAAAAAEETAHERVDNNNGPKGKNECITLHA